MTKKAVPVDLAEFDKLTKAQEDGIDVEIKGPDGKTPLGFSIKIAGPDSERRKKAVQAIMDERIEDEDLDAPTAADNAENVKRVTAAATISWTSFILDGSEYPCTEDNALALYSRFAWMYEQVLAKGARRSAFTKG